MKDDRVMMFPRFLNAPMGDKHSKGDAVVMLQIWLFAKNYYTGKITGIYDVCVAQGVQILQKLLFSNRSCQWDGSFGPSTRKAVEDKFGINFNDIPFASTDNFMIIALQVWLSAKGYYTGKITGIYDHNTTRALAVYVVREDSCFEKKYEWEWDGTFSKDVRMLMNEQHSIDFDAIPFFSETEGLCPDGEIIVTGTIE